MNNKLDSVLDSISKVKIIRLLTSRTKDFMASGREIARLVKLSPPTAHSALKELLDERIVERHIIGKQHIYKLNYAHRTVKEILSPAFGKERLLKDDIAYYLVAALKKHKLLSPVESLILCGSIARGVTHGESDCDVAVIVRDEKSRGKIEQYFLDSIAPRFLSYFGIHLDPYVKAAAEFTRRLRRRLPPVSTLMKSYLVIYGKDPLDYR